MGNRCELCGNVKQPGGCLCEGCREALLTEQTAIAPSIMAQIQGTKPAIVGATTDEALQALCADARCSQPRAPGTVFCALCMERLRAARQTAECHARLLPAREEELEEALVEGGWYEGRLTIAGEEPLGAFRGLCNGVLIVAVGLVLLYAIGWTHGIR